MDYLLHHIVSYKIVRGACRTYYYICIYHLAWKVLKFRCLAVKLLCKLNRPLVGSCRYHYILNAVIFEMLCSKLAHLAGANKHYRFIFQMLKYLFSKFNCCITYGYSALCNPCFCPYHLCNRYCLFKEPV